MTSTKTMDDYADRTLSLLNLMHENLSKANDLVVENSPVDFNTHKFICFIHNSIINGFLVHTGFCCADALRKHDDEYIKIFHLLEKRLAVQNEFFEKLGSTHKARA